MSELSLSPFCVHIATKKSYFAKKPPMTESELMDGSGACWCKKTMQAIGPDREMVDPDDCRTGRSCFQTVLDLAAAGE